MQINYSQHGPPDYILSAHRDAAWSSPAQSLKFKPTLRREASIQRAPPHICNTIKFLENWGFFTDPLTQTHLICKIPFPLLWCQQEKSVLLGNSRNTQQALQLAAFSEEGRLTCVCGLEVAVWLHINLALARLEKEMLSLPRILIPPNS